MGRHHRYRDHRYNGGKLILGIILVAIAFLVVFTPASFEFFDKYWRFVSIEGIGFVFIGVGIIGFILILQSLSRFR